MVDGEATRGNVVRKTQVALDGWNRKQRVDRIVAGPDVTTVGGPVTVDQCSVPALTVPTAAMPHSAPHTNTGVGI
jgi:hypothetical protein